MKVKHIVLVEQLIDDSIDGRHWVAMTKIDLYDFFTEDEIRRLITDNDQEILKRMANYSSSIQEYIFNIIQRKDNDIHNIIISKHDIMNRFLLAKPEVLDNKAKLNMETTWISLGNGPIRIRNSFDI